MIANIADVIGIMGEDGLLLYKSPNIEKWFGWQPKDLIGTDGWANVHPDDLERVKREYHGILERENVTGMAEYRYKCKDGTYKWIQNTATNLSHDPIIKGVLMNYHDITERKISEEAFQKKNEQLRAIFETAINVSFIITDAQDPEPIVLEFSPGAEKIFGYGKDEILGNPVSILHLPEDVKNFAHVHQQMRDKKIGFSGETTLVKKSGIKFSALFSTHPLFDSKGQMYAALGVCMDISRQKQLEDRIRQSHKMESIGILAGGIAHDFNNILFPLIGYAEMLQEDLPQGSLEQTNSTQILQAGLRARDLVKQILAFSQKSVPELKAVRLQTILSEALNLLGSSIPKTIEIKTKIQTENCIVVADPTQLHQVMMNLGTNAYHSMQTSGGTLTIMLDEIEVNPNASSDLQPGSYALLTFEDTGTGIKKEILKKIFDPYFTTKETGQGSGLGLSVALGIVKSCKGDIFIDSEPGKGTHVRVYLPLIKKGIAHKGFDSLETIHGGSEKILLVDDDELIITMACQILQRLGYTVTTSSASLDALAVFKTNPGEFDLIITDMTMPNLTGIQLAQEIHEIRSDIPIIICTGFSDQIDEDSCEKMGIQGFIMKPIIRSEMAHKIREVLDGQNNEEGWETDA